MVRLPDEEVARIAFRVAAKNLCGVDLPDGFPFKISYDEDGVVTASWPDGFHELVAQFRKEVGK